ncbi:unnamed protein product, partial [Urochloa humidicola]
MAAAAVVSVSMGVMKPLLAKLTTLMGDEYKKLKGVRKQVSFLKDELTSMNAFLESLELMDDDLDPLAKDWRSHVREMAYDIEDCIDDFLHNLESTTGPGESEGFVKKAARRLRTLRVRHCIANQIDELKARVLDAGERRKRYKLDERVRTSGPSSSVTIDPRVQALYTEAANLVGIDGPREELVKCLTDRAEQQLKVVSIVGFGGLGKTTLAKEAYHNILSDVNNDTGKKFSCSAFVSVSQRPHLSNLLSSIQSKLQICNSSPARDMQDIIDTIKDHLKHKRYLIVVDDLWDAQTWDIISCAFPENNNGSRVIVTTRVEDVASRACRHQHQYIFRMEPLNSQDSRRLFFKRIFGREDGCPSQFEEVSTEILKKCGGLPLAIITIASLLASRQAKLRKQWENIVSSLITHNNGTNPTLEGMRHILDLSYRDLSPHLRTCLLYLGIYPEDHVISRDDLIRQWMAEGFVSNFHGQDPNDVAKSYFNELINRSLIQPEGTDTGEVTSCRVHDMILDLILCRCQEDNFITLVRNNSSAGDMAPRQHDNRVRRVSLDMSKKSISNADEDSRIISGSTCMPQVRSLAIFLGEFKNVPPLVLLKHLRVLMFEYHCYPGNIYEIDLTHIAQLFQLRYLKIKAEGRIQLVLPTKVRGLKHLDTLEISLDYDNYPSIEVPSDIVYLSRLSCLIVPWKTRMPDDAQLDKMKSLRTLKGFVLGSRELRCLGELSNLRELEITTYDLRLWASDERNAWFDALGSSLRKLRELRYFRAIGYETDNFDQDERVGGSSCHPPPLHSLEQLVLQGLKFPRVPRWINGDLLRNLFRL